MSDEKEAAVRRAAEVVRDMKTSTAAWADDTARVALDASGVWERIEELERENVRLREALSELSTFGDESWKTPGHAMNEWVSKARVQSLARAALAVSPSGETAE